MNMNKLLEKQIKRYFPVDIHQQEKLSEFINAVNNSYNAFDKDIALSAHAFKISEQDYETINEQLKQEIYTKRLGVKNLKEAIRVIDDSLEFGEIMRLDENNLIGTLEFLKKQIEKRKGLEEDLKLSERLQSATANRMKQLISNLQNGILVEDEHGRINLANQLFCNMFGIEAPPERLVGLKASRYI